MKTIEVLPVGTRVKFRDGEIEGTVTQVCIQSGEKVSYEVAWWSGSTRNVGWVANVEIEPVANIRRQRIGFAC